MSRLSGLKASRQAGPVRRRRLGQRGRAIVPAAVLGALLMTAPAAHAVTFSYTITPGTSVTFPSDDVEAISGSFTLPSSSGSFVGSLTLSGSGPEAGQYTCVFCTVFVGSSFVFLDFDNALPDTSPAGVNLLALDFSGSLGSPLTLEDGDTTHFTVPPDNAATFAVSATGGATLPVPEPPAAAILTAALGLLAFARRLGKEIT